MRHDVGDEFRRRRSQFTSPAAARWQSCRTCKMRGACSRTRSSGAPQPQSSCETWRPTPAGRFATPPKSCAARSAEARRHRKAPRRHAAAPPPARACRYRWSSIVQRCVSRQGHWNGTSASLARSTSAPPPPPRRTASRLPSSTLCGLTRRRARRRRSSAARTQGRRRWRSCHMGTPCTRRCCGRCSRSTGACRRGLARDLCSQRGSAPTSCLPPATAVQGVGAILTAGVRTRVGSVLLNMLLWCLQAAVRRGAAPSRRKGRRASRPCPERVLSRCPRARRRGPLRRVFAAGRRAGAAGAYLGGRLCVHSHHALASPTASASGQTLSGHCRRWTRTVEAVTSLAYGASPWICAAAVPPCTSPRSPHRSPPPPRRV